MKSLSLLFNYFLQPIGSQSSSAGEKSTKRVVLRQATGLVPLSLPPPLPLVSLHRSVGAPAVPSAGSHHLCPESRLPRGAKSRLCRRTDGRGAARKRRGKALATGRQTGVVAGLRSLRRSLLRCHGDTQLPAPFPATPLPEQQHPAVLNKQGSSLILQFALLRLD